MENSPEVQRFIEEWTPKKPAANDNVWFMPMPKIEYHITEFVVASMVMLTITYFMLPQLIRFSVWIFDFFGGNHV